MSTPREKPKNGLAMRDTEGYFFRSNHNEIVYQGWTIYYNVAIYHEKKTSQCYEDPQKLSNNPSKLEEEEIRMRATALVLKNRYTHAANKSAFYDSKYNQRPIKFSHNKKIYKIRGNITITRKYSFIGKGRKHYCPLYKKSKFTQSLWILSHWRLVLC